MKTLFLLAVLFGGVSAISADTLSIRNEVHEGDFEKFENGKFTFRIPFGETLSVSASSVKTLELTKPRAVSFLLTGKQAEEQANLHGFQRSKFTLEQKGGMRMVYAMKVKRLEVKPQAAPSGSGSPEAPGPKGFVDISHIEGRTDLPQDQMSALRRYVAARDRYQAFAEESSRLIGAANSLTGDRRLRKLNELRARKNQEQPLLLELNQAEASLFQAFPTAE